MAECHYCREKYIAIDSDAGTYLEHYCSIDCEQKAEKEIEDYLENIKGANMPEKEQIIITIESEKKKEFRIACINEDINMTDKLNDLIDEYLKGSS